MPLLDSDECWLPAGCKSHSDRKRRAILLEQPTSVTKLHDGSAEPPPNSPPCPVPPAPAPLLLLPLCLLALLLVVLLLLLKLLFQRAAAPAVLASAAYQNWAGIDQIMQELSRNLCVKPLPEYHHWSL